jgi:hypothetical protein
MAEDALSNLAKCYEQLTFPLLDPFPSASSLESPTTGKRGTAVHPDSAVRRRTTKRSLPCNQTKPHDKELQHGKRDNERP